MAPVRQRQPLSEETKALLAKLSSHSSNFAQTPLRTPGVPSRCRERGQRLQQQQLNLKMNKDLGHVNTSSDSEGYLFKPLAKPFQRKQSANAPELLKNGEQSTQQGRGHVASRVDEKAAANARLAEQSKNSASAGSSKQPSISTPVISGNGRRQVKERRDIYAIGESQGAADQETRTNRKITLQRQHDNERLVSETNVGREQEGQGGEIDGYHVSASSQESRTLELRINQLRQGAKTPMKTYSQNRTIAASQGGRIAVEEQEAEEDSDDQDSL
jgi:hypothetical protein